jgi:subtilase family serine protease
LTPENGWAIGTHKLYTVLYDRFGDFEIEVEIRPAPLPDIQPIEIKVENLSDSPGKRVCTVARNVGAAVAGPFQFALYVDGVEPLVGRPSVPILGAYELAERCVELSLPPGTHRLKAVVDEPQHLMELNETNNVLEQPIAVADAASSPAQTPSLAQADLTVNAIRVNGQAPDGKNDCKDGKNDIAVVVKNAGTTESENATVRLIVDDAQSSALEQAVKGLEAGQEREVRFGDVRLKKGEHSLTAIADTKKATAESKEHNNELKVSARCTAAD